MSTEWTEMQQLLFDEIRAVCAPSGMFQTTHHVYSLVRQTGIVPTDAARNLVSTAMFFGLNPIPWRDCMELHRPWAGACVGSCMRTRNPPHQVKETTCAVLFDLFFDVDTEAARA